MKRTALALAAILATSGPMFAQDLLGTMAFPSAPVAKTVATDDGIATLDRTVTHGITPTASQRRAQKIKRTANASGQVQASGAGITIYPR